MAIDFDNTTMQVASPDATVRGLTVVTMMAWVKLDDTDGYQGFLSVNGAGGTFQKVFGLVASPSPSLYMAIRHATRDATATHAPPSVGEWHHVCGRWDATYDAGRPELVLDGTVLGVTSESPQGAQASDDGPLMVGATVAFGLLPLDGKLADAAIFDRRLSDAEVRLIADGCLRANHLDPVWHMTLEGESGTPAVGDVGLRDTVGGNHVSVLSNPVGYCADPPLHWPGDGVHAVSGGRTTANSRPTMNVIPGVKPATMRRAR